MSTDGGLRRIFAEHLPMFHFQSVETGGTGRGIPDTNFCGDGAEGWLEFKATDGWRVTIAPEQVAWAERRLRAGGRVFLAVRRKASAGPRRGAAVDTLYLYSGAKIRPLAGHAITDVLRLGQWEGGPAQWDWEAVRKLLIRSAP
jgi:hypothetical protein